MSLNYYFLFLSIFPLLSILNVSFAASSGATKGTYKVVNENLNIPCLILQADIYLYLTYQTNDGENDVTVHVPTSSSVDSSISSCDTIIYTAGLSVKSQLMRINFDHMDGWSMDLAFTQDNTFKTDNGQEYTLFQVNVTANFGSDPETFPNAKDNIVHYYLHIDKNDLSDISGSIYAETGTSYYCPSKQKYVINNNEKYGPSAYIMFQLTSLQAYMTSSSFGERSTCPSDQQVTDIIPIIVGSVLAALIILTLLVYLIYRSCLPDDVINLVNPESHFVYENGVKIDDSLHIN